MLYSRRSRCWKIADFGFTSAGSSTLAQSIGGRGSVGYRAPELLSVGEFSRSSDIWALGCILYEMCMRRKAFRSDWETSRFADSNTETSISIPVTRDPDPNCDRCSRVFQEFMQQEALEDLNQTLKSMFDIDSKKRPSAKTLKSKWESWES